jgi:short-subunit dehydrogenase
MDLELERLSKVRPLGMAEAVQHDQHDSFCDAVAHPTREERPDSVYRARESAAVLCADTTVLINNAGIISSGSVLSRDALERGRREFDTNVFGTLATTAAFAPILAANGGGAIINVLSVLAWVSSPGAGLYCASKAAAWSLTNALRLELLAQKTHVVALHVGYMDTDMTAGVTAPKSSPDAVATSALRRLEAGAFEVLADEVSRRVRSALSGELTALYPTIA